MDQPRHRRTHRVSARRAVGCLKAASVGAVLVAVVVTSAGTSPSPGAASAGRATPGSATQVVQRAVAEHGCRTGGLGGAVPASALVRTPRGAVRQVSFDVGWDVYNGRRPGTLVAVCLDEVPED